MERYLQYAGVVRHWDQVPAEDVERAVGCFFPVAEKLQEELKDISETESNWVKVDFTTFLKRLLHLDQSFLARNNVFATTLPDTHQLQPRLYFSAASFL